MTDKARPRKQIEQNQNGISFENEQRVLGYDFNNGIDHHQLLQSYLNTGFQATNFGLAVKEINSMLKKRNESLPDEFFDTKLEKVVTWRQHDAIKMGDRCDQNCPATGYPDDIKISNNCTIFLGYTSNMISCGVRETIRFLTQHKMVDCIVTTAGGVEEDFIKCLSNGMVVGKFSFKGADLFNQRLNRQGNLLIHEDSYQLFEDWIMPIFDEMLEEQRKDGVIWTPSKMIKRLGLAINDENSVYYWAAKNDIPVFSPALTDGAMGELLFFHANRNPQGGLILDTAQDVCKIGRIALESANTGMVVAGGGMAKHHICLANSMRLGADFSVYINTSSEFDGSDSGARPDEAVSWGKIRSDANPVKVTADASLIFPLLVAETFARHHHKAGDVPN